jgi:hypothetical protein
MGALLALAVLLINIPVLPRAIIERFGDHLWFRILISHHLFGTLLLLGLCIWCLAHLPAGEGSASPGALAGRSAAR